MRADSERSIVFLRALRATLVRPPLWLFVWLGPLLAGLAIAGSWAGWFHGALEHRYAPGAMVASLEENFRFDHREALATLDRAGAQLAAPLALALMLFGIFTAGGWLQVFLERTSGKSVKRFLWGGARYFGRFFRVWILTLLGLSLVTWLVYGWPWKTLVLEILFGLPDAELEELDSELTAVWLGWMQAGLYALCFGLTLVWGDYTRTRLALHDTRSSLWAGLCTLGLLLRHPVRTLRPFLLLLVLEALVVVLLGSLSWGVNADLGPESRWPAILVLFGVGQLALLWQTISRGARYHAAVQVSRVLVQPLFQPDPWAKRIGGPGGPQYLVEEGDEYGVAY
jgi:hypothetical protein